METTVYISRHSEPCKDLFGDYQTYENEQTRNEKTILSINGEQKAQKLSDCSMLHHVEVLYSSHYVRAMSTAKYIASKNHIKLNVDERLGERKIGVQYRNEIPPYFTYYQLKDWNYKLKNGESLNECKERITKCLYDILTKNHGKTIMIVSHGAILKTLFSNWCQITVNEETKQPDIFYHNKLLISGKWNCPELFKLVFDEENNLISIERVHKIQL